MTETEYRHLAGNIEELIEVHRAMANSVEETSQLSPREQRLGKVLLHHGSSVKSAHKTYWGNHPKAVCVLEKHRDRLDKLMEGEDLECFPGGNQ